MTRAFLAAAALLALACAGLLGLLASDVRQWEKRLVHDGLAFRETPDHPGLFRSDERFPGGAASRLLGDRRRSRLPARAPAPLDERRRYAR